MRLIQFQLPEKGRRIGCIDGEHVVDLTSVNTEWTRIYNIFLEARRSGRTIDAYLAATSTEAADRVCCIINFSPGDWEMRAAGFCPHLTTRTQLTAQFPGQD